MPLFKSTFLRAIACSILLFQLHCATSTKGTDKPTGDANGPADADQGVDIDPAIDTNPGADTNQTVDSNQSLDSQSTSPDSAPDAGPFICTTNEDCVEITGYPAAPPNPCGSCLAVCENQECGAICYEARACMFTAGCGPNCEPLCNSTEDCNIFGDHDCIDGICKFSVPGKVQDSIGVIYSTVDIGEQTWMAENLKTPSDNDFFYNDDTDLYNFGPYARLYTQEDAKTICMEGWHLPTDEDWMQLEIFLGMTEEHANLVSSDTMLRGTDEGGKLKETGTEWWEAPNEGATNETGFSALPGGFRNPDGTYEGMGKEGRFWSTTSSRRLSFDRAQIDRDITDPEYGLSVRCVKD